MSDQTNRAAWMAGHYGLMTHWLYPGVLPEKAKPARSLDEAVEGFQVDRLLEAVEAAGAGWLIFTLGQNTGFYASPNPVIEGLAGPGHCSQRDLAREIAEGLHRMEKRFIAYLPCEIYANTSLHAGFAWRLEEGTDQVEFQRRYTQAVAAWAERLGSLLDGWWFDGCYPWPYFHNSRMEWPRWYAAARQGNPQAALAFNDGSFCVGSLAPVASGQDYLSGEAEMLVGGKIRLGRDEYRRTHLPEGQIISEVQWHCLLPVDCFWGHGNPPPAWLPDNPYQAIDPAAYSIDALAPMEPPIYGDAELGGFLHACLSVGGAVTMNVGIFQEGNLGPATIEQLKRIGAKG